MSQTATRHEFRPSWAAWFWSLVLSMGLLAPWAWWRRRGVRYEILDDRVVRHTGRLSSATEEIQLADVSRIETRQSIGDRLFGTGSIVVDTGVDRLVLSSIPNHDRVAETIRSRQ